MVQWKIGTTLRMVLAVESGEVTGAEAVRCVLKQVPGDGMPEALEMAVEFASASGGEPDRWYLEASAEASQNLRPGFYFGDIRIQAGNGTVTQTSTFRVEMIERVTEASV